MRSVLATSLALALAAASVIACSSTSTVTPTDTSDAGGAGPGGEADEDAGSGEPAGPMTLTSTAFDDGDELPPVHSCQGEGGKKEVSPPLSWTPGPEGTLSYAIVFIDATTDFLHSAIYDIPADTTSLAQGLAAKYELSKPAGAKQSLSYKGTPGYAGPCPREPHEYEFILYALKVEKLEGLAADSTVADADKAIKKQKLESTKLTLKFTPK
ncbi:MAG: YbhB/YbcL family Raf kinase inhibitor-like protein [Labilithrix sp.]|nr:YbhB/YbcL family Raf kinase inhibitor-like protein [Labilithrix sp.]